MVVTVGSSEYLNDSCDRLKMCRDDYVLMETVLRQSGGGQKSPWGKPCLSFQNCRQLLVRSQGTKLTCDSVMTVTSYNHMETRIKIIHDKHFTTCLRHVHDRYDNMETRLWGWVGAGHH
jgi:hypothetical protein